MALHHVESVVHPATLEEAWAEKERRGKTARLVGGGIDVVLYSPSTVSTLIDLKALGLSRIRETATGIAIGATATMTEAIESPALKAYAGGFLVRVLREVASPLQRNLATIGGTIGSAHPWSDVIPALLVLDAKLAVYDGEERTIPLQAYLEGRRGEASPIICTIDLPSDSASSRGTLASFTRTGFDVALLNVACCGRVAGGTWEDVRIAIGGTPGLAARQGAAEDALIGNPATSGTIAAAANAAAGAIDARDDLRASAEYRRTLARVLVERCLTEIVSGTEGGAG